MPHLVIEITKGLLPASGAAGLLPALHDIHAELGRLGYAREDDMKSRVIVADAALAGLDPGGQFIVATLNMTQPRPDSMQKAMGRLIHARLQRFIEEGAPSCWWQCCLFFRYVGSEAYLKSASAS